MDQGFVSQEASASAADTWGLSAIQLSRIQGLVVSGFSHLPVTKALFLRLDQPGGAWLKALEQVAPVTSASGRLNRATAIAFTSAGLRQIGFRTEDDIQTFSLPFNEGMHQVDRRRRLGDEEKN